MTNNHKKIINESRWGTILGMLIGFITLTIMIALNQFYEDVGIGKQQATWELFSFELDAAAGGAFFVILASLPTFILTLLFESKISKTILYNETFLGIIIGSIGIGAGLLVIKLVTPFLFGKSLDIMESFKHIFNNTIQRDNLLISVAYQNISAYFVSLGINHVLSSAITIGVQVATLIATIEGCLAFYDRILKKMKGTL